MQHDVFICHASEDKEDFVRPLAELLKQQNIDVWYDEFSLSIGDSLTKKIDEGLARSRFGIVVLSPHFFQKPWAKRELSGLTAREMAEKRDLILPIWHRIGISDILQFSPPLADKKAASSATGINVVLREIIKKIRPEESPLLVAQDHLVSLKLDPPPISDEWWLDMIEHKEFLLSPDLNAQTRWIFPLPFPGAERGRERGLNIASAALQIDWSFEGEELNISPTTHPDEVHDFIHRWPGLYECARNNPAVLALYVPQLTIPGFDSGFEDVFDDLLQLKDRKTKNILSYGPHDIMDNSEPACSHIIALRHPKFGNYSASDLAHWYFDTHDYQYYRSDWNIFEGLIWLLSDDSSWLPENYREMFIRGISIQDRWVKSIEDAAHNPFSYGLITKTRKQFKFTKSTKKGLYDLVEEAKKNLSVLADTEKIIRSLMNINIIKNYYDFQEWMDELRSTRRKKYQS